MTQAILNRSHLDALEKQLFWLEHSYALCEKIGTKESYNIEETDSYETLCGRFARSIDFLVRKVFRSLDAVEFESQGSLIDTVHHAHRRDLFASMDQINTLRDLRNEIVHEYIDEALGLIFHDILQNSPALILIIKNTLSYSEKYR